MRSANQGFPVRACAALGLAVVATVLFPGPAPAEPVITTLTFTPTADAYVREKYPNNNYGKSSSLYVDKREAKESFLRFELSGLTDVTVLDVRLRLYQKDVSDSGGFVWLLPNNDWSETAITWNTRPTGFKTGAYLADFGQANKAAWDSASLGPIVTGDGPLSLALDSPSTDGANWASSNSSNRPVLEVDVEVDNTSPLDGVTTIAGPTTGSSDPTYYASNRRLAVTEGGRVLAVHGRHATGVQLAWRDPWGSWSNLTTGDVTDGLLLRGTGTGDWPASIVLANDSAGEQHAWVVWSGATSSSPRGVQMRRLSDLDDPDGPSVGPLVEIAPPGVAGETGNSRVDLVFEPETDGTPRGLIAWTRRVAASSWRVEYVWFTDLDTPSPPLHDRGVLFNASTGGYHGTLTQTGDGIAWFGRFPSGSLRMFRHTTGAPPTEWGQVSAAGIGLSSKSFPSAVTLDSGDTMVAVESKPVDDVVRIQHFTPAGPKTALTLSGRYSQPTLASNGNEAWIVMVRNSDGVVVSREFDGTDWGPDRVEMGSQTSDFYAWPNAVRDVVDDRLRFVVEGPVGGSATNAVLAYQRLLAPTP